LSCLDGGTVDLNGDVVDGCVGSRSSGASWGIELGQINGEGPSCLFNTIDKEFELIEVEGLKRVLADFF